jgi:hypothetical protein
MKQAIVTARLLAVGAGGSGQRRANRAQMAAPAPMASRRFIPVVEWLTRLMPWNISLAARAHFV